MLLEAGSHRDESAYNETLIQAPDHLWYSSPIRSVPRWLFTYCMSLQKC